MYCKITLWGGRLGNNLIQILNCIYFAIEHECEYIEFPPHSFFTDTKIKLINEKESITSSKLIKSAVFFYYKRDTGKEPPTHQKRRILAQKYVLPIFKIKIRDIPPISNDTLVIHLRSGDIFSSNPHNLYVQPPLEYYNKVSDKFKDTFIVYEDNKNPCVNPLISKFPNQSDTLEKDLTKLFSSVNLCCGFGTFCFIIYYLSLNLKKIIIPKYDKHSEDDISLNILDLKKETCDDGVQITNIYLPKYIRPREWKNTIEQRNLMLTYTFPDDYPTMD